MDVDGKPQHWPQGHATFYTDPAMAPDRVKAIRRAATTWSSVPGSAFRFHWGGPSPSADIHAILNGNSDVYFDSGLPPFVYAVTYSVSGGEAIKEKDVKFNDSFTWTTDGTPEGAEDVETVALHELGHVLGLMHEEAAPSVMHAAANAAIPNRALYPDDEAGVRFLYPGAGGTVTKPTRVDLAAGVLAITSGAPGAGRTLDMTLEVKDLSPAPPGPFRVIAMLSPRLPVSFRDLEIGSTAVSDLAGSGTATAALSVEVPEDSPPGTWRIGAFLDPENDVGDPDRSDNAAVTEAFLVTRPPFVAELGDGMNAPLGPFGADTAEIWIGAGTQVTVRARGSGGVRPLLRIRSALQGTVLAEIAGRKSATLRWTAPADGVYFVDLGNGAAGPGRIRATTAGLVSLVGLPLSAPGEVPFPAYVGGTVLLAVEPGAGGASPGPLGCRPPVGFEITTPATLRGTVAGLGPFTPGFTGSHVLILHGSGDALCTILSSTPRRGTLIER